MQVFVMPPKVSWTTTLANLKIGEQLPVPEDVGRKTVAPRISREMKLKYPDREFETDRTSSPGVMIITRKK